MTDEQIVDFYTEKMLSFINDMMDEASQQGHKNLMLKAQRKFCREINPKKRPETPKEAFDKLASPKMFKNGKLRESQREHLEILELIDERGPLSGDEIAEIFNGKDGKDHLLNVRPKITALSKMGVLKVVGHKSNKNHKTVGVYDINPDRLNELAG